MTDRDSQLTSSVLMIRPTCFYGNPLTATSNRFQVKTDANIADQLKKVLEEFELFTIALKKCGVEVIEFNDTVYDLTVFKSFLIGISITDGIKLVVYRCQKRTERVDR